MRSSEHVGFAYNTRGNGNGGDCGVEFCVGGREEKLIQEAAAFGDG